MDKKIILSGIQPSGKLHLGNYLGALKKWREMTESSPENEFFFMIANLHSLTSFTDKHQLSANVNDLIAYYLAIGLNEKTRNATIFIQSDISYHAELTWLLTTITPMGWVERMTQFKDKSRKREEENDTICLGLLSYPVLMAADILLYQADMVPVGEDQKQHIELTRDIAQRFHHITGQEVFKLPSPLIEGDCKRVMSLTTPTSKMSKSDSNQKGCIYLEDSDDTIAAKIKSATTDSIMGITYEESRPGVMNLINIFAACSNLNPDELVEKYGNLGTGAFKKDMAEAVIAHISPIREKFLYIRNDRQLISKVTEASNDKARQFAKKTFDAAKTALFS